MRDLVAQLRLNAEDFRYDNANEYASHGVLMLNAALDLENYARWTEHLEAENQRLVDKYNATITKLKEAQRLIEAWLGHSEHHHLTVDEFNQLVWDSQDLVDEILDGKKNG